MIKKHEIKIDPEYFNDVVEKRKTFEVRKNDRAYEVGDLLQIQEYNRETKEYTGRELWTSITYILDDQEYLRDGYVILALEILEVNN
ncbi:DUF3850 domain-containing protein [Sebaldella sp. S0638]|uniref:DUF3850 domain-containing protein n=1 Tax=Sebaldella sp. S0638 TaxID=2957809 RepID=UPI0020A11A50|nr:DUF3850 domain-containing protein [Sebaldella sp. S0638]MCP1226160.1 DUF3850 domain-containing protein [Sebaldella sp. S0638]